MAAPFGVKWPEAGDGTPAREEVTRVDVREGDCVRAKVESGSGPHTIFEVSAKGGVEGIKFVDVSLIVVE